MSYEALAFTYAPWGPDPKAGPAANRVLGAGGLVTKGGKDGRERRVGSERLLLVRLGTSVFERLSTGTVGNPEI